MYRYSLIAALAVSITLTPAHYLHAAEGETHAIYAKQIAAVGDYIERTFNLQSTEPLENEELRTIIRNGNTWLANTQMEKGRFNYEFAPYEDKYLEDDHIVRQGGVLYALGETARRDPEETILIGETIKKAITYFESISREDSADGRTFKCISHNEISSICPLGATSLAVTGILGYLEQHPEKEAEYRELVDFYIAYILAMKKPGEGFRDRHRIGEATQSENESSFSNGEALLALARYYRQHPRGDVQEVIDETFAYLKDLEYDAPLYLWIMAALKDMYALWPNDAYLEYAEAYTDWRVARASRFRGTNRNYCAYSEGLASAYALLYDTLPESERTFLRNELDYWNTKNSRLMLSPEDEYRIVEGNGTLTIAHVQSPERTYGGFLTGESELTQRIDFTQHCIGAYLQTLVDIDGELIEI